MTVVVGAKDPMPTTDPTSVAPATVDDKSQEGTEVVIPVFDLVRVEPSGDAVVAGKGAPKSKVDLLSGQDVIASGIANETGEWALTLDNPLTPGAHDLTVRTTSPDGQTIKTSTQRVAVSIPQGGKGEVLVVLNEPGAASAVLQLPNSDEQGTAAPEQTASAEMKADQADSSNLSVSANAESGQPTTAAETSAEVSTSVETPGQPAEGGPTSVVTATLSSPGASTSTSKPTPAGTEESSTANGQIVASANPDASASPVQSDGSVTVEAVEIENGKTLYAAGAGKGRIFIYIDDAFAGETDTADKSRWIFRKSLSEPPSSGAHRLRADVVDSDGQVLSRAEVSFTGAPEGEEGVYSAAISGTGSAQATAGEGLSGEARVAPPEKIIIREGDNLWTISRRIYGFGGRFSTIYQANTDQIRNPDLIYPGQVFVVPKSDANWGKDSLSTVR
ncbi:LysM domain/BON superfamily protein [Hartmannibacter diazotrophicus]|uniref:LysM domain/BON superfamily protein n=1 Tax=Hartmannibacter diazotrophicus TaxID=1482074 RepID=A0A2C9D6I4_9HYPH|nr:LysM peptidoglycan-binding domain-containing protein [Hartmannibacter diazotrophicus]SON55932.1 LysM domain/BON superfamily protein [Hartmannibacter diazotrophicus]